MRRFKKPAPQLIQGPNGPVFLPFDEMLKQICWVDKRWRSEEWAAAFLRCVKALMGFPDDTILVLQNSDHEKVCAVLKEANVNPDAAMGVTTLIIAVITADTYDETEIAQPS